MGGSAEAPRRGLRAIPRSIWALGFVSLFMDLSSEAIHSLLPLFLVAGLGVSAEAIGLLEGTAEALVLFTKMASGAWSDRLGKRKALALAGYGLAAASKPLFPLATGFGLVVVARLADRLGKGIRGAPRDALIADLTPAAARGAAFGLRQALDTVGALAGPLLATLLMVASGGRFRLVFWIATVPAVIAVGLLAALVHEPRSPSTAPLRRPLLAWNLLGAFPRAFWPVVASGGVLTLARFSEAFLVLRAETVGVALDYAPLVMVAMNAVYGVVVYPAGRLSDTVGRWGMLVIGILPLIAADLVLARAQGATALAAGAMLWGLHMGLTQGLLPALVADAAPAELRGTAFGLFNLVGGASLLVASAVAGLLWARIGPSATFYAGAAFATAAVIGLAFRRRRSPTP